MKKNTYKIIALITLLSIVSYCNISSIATAKTISIDEKLYQRGYPIEIVELLCEQAKQDLINDNAKFDNATIETFNKQAVHTSTKLFNNNGTDTEKILLSEPTYLKLTWIVSNLNNGKKQIMINYNWSQLPFSRFQDLMFITWDNAKLSAEWDSFKRVDTYKYYYKTKPSNILTGIKTNSNACASTAEYGCSWYPNLKGYSIDKKIVELNGYGKINLIPKVSDNSEISGKYIHKKSISPLSESFNLTKQYEFATCPTKISF